MLLVAATLACPVGMGLMMWMMMMRGHGGAHHTVNPVSEPPARDLKFVTWVWLAATGRNDTACGAGRRIDLLSWYVESR